MSPAAQTERKPVRVLALVGSPRPGGNSTIMADRLLRGAADRGAAVERVDLATCTIHPCQGCLRCNVRQRCVLEGDDWPQLSAQISAADVVVFSSPIYFHHVSAPLKQVIDRFRSFVRVQLTETGLVHTPWQPWRKRLIVLASMGASDPEEARPVRELFTFIAGILGPAVTFDLVLGRRLAVARQVSMRPERLARVYSGLGLPPALARQDAAWNRRLLAHCYRVGAGLVEPACDARQNRL